MYTCIRTHVNTYRDIHISAHTETQHRYTQTYAQSIQIHAAAYSETCRNTHTHTHIHVYTRTDSEKHKDSSTHTHTRYT